MYIDEIKEYLPHRYPFLLVDRVVELVPGERIVGYKNVTINEPFFDGHFPDYKVMPGVLIVEAMAQMAGILGFKTRGDKPEKNSMYMFVGTDNLRFKRPVVPGDRLMMNAGILSERRGIWKFNVSAAVEDEFVASATILCAHRQLNT